MTVTPAAAAAASLDVFATTPGLYIDGVGRVGRGAPVIVIDPATNAVLGEVPGADKHDVDDALAAADRGLAVWRATTVWQRATVLRDAAALLRARSNELAVVLSTEQGKPYAQAAVEFVGVADLFEWYAGLIEHQSEHKVAGRAPGRSFAVRREPIGVVAAFTPWNFPALLPGRKVAATIASGCSLVIKPAEETPYSTLAIAAICSEAGLPDGVVNVVIGEPAAISTQLVTDRRVRKVSLTGSTAVGRQLMELAARGTKPVTMELGGHAPVVVHDDVNVEAVAAELATWKFRNAGQVCVSPTRFFVAESILAEFTDAFVAHAEGVVVGPATDSASTMGPLANARRVEAVDALVVDAIEHGAQLLTGGERLSSLGDGNWYAPTVLGRVTPAMRIMRDEPFGPVAPLVSFDDDGGSNDAVITAANDSDFGLAGYVFSGDLARAEATARRLDVGMAGANTLAISTAEAPFGGVKSSGFGREGGAEGLDDYTVVKYVASQS